MHTKLSQFQSVVNVIFLIFLEVSKTHLMIYRGKAPVVLLHRITSLYSSFEEIRIFTPTQKVDEKTEQIMFCFRTELNTKSLFTTTSNVLPFKFKHWQQKFCRVKLIPWNLVNLSHLYSRFDSIFTGMWPTIFCLSNSSIDNKNSVEWSWFLET